MNLPSIKPQQIGDELVQTVDGRELHAFLGIRRQYSMWVRDQITRASFIADKDFVVGSTPEGVKVNGRPRIEYFFTLKAGKHIGMLSQTERGIQVREYFIECERRLMAVEKAPTPAADVDLDDPVQFAMIGQKLYALSQRQGETIKKQAVVIDQQDTCIRDMAPMVDGFERIAGMGGLLCLTDAAKALQMRPKDLIDRLLARKWLYRRKSSGDLVASEPVIQKGFLKPKFSVERKKNGDPKWVTACVTPLGLTHMAQRLGIESVQLTLPRLN
jgi:anti-repressor protein